MMTSQEGQRVDWETVRQRAADRARKLWALSLSLFVVLVVSIAVSDFLKPLLLQVREWRELSPTGGVAPGEVLTWVSLRVLRAAPALALAAAIWAAQNYLRHLGAGELWNAGTARLLRRVGSALLLSAALTAVGVPSGTRWLEARGGFDVMLSTEVLTLGVLGALLIVMADLLKDVLQTSSALKADSEGFV